MNGSVTSGPLVIKSVEVAGRGSQNVRIQNGRIHEISETPPSTRGATVLQGNSGALIRGLHDHHLHLFASAAADASVQCGPDQVHDAAHLSVVLRVAAARETGWVRGVGYDERTAGHLTATRLDSLLGKLKDKPVRVQHRSGHAWFLNTAALRLLDLGPDEDAYLRVEERLRELPLGQPPEIAALSHRLASFGITSFTDAGVFNRTSELTALRHAADAGELLQRCIVMGTDDLNTATGHPTVRVGPRKIVLAEHDLPALDELSDLIRKAGARNVAIHAVSLDSLMLAVAALGDAGNGMHRIEHASVAPPFAVEAVAKVQAQVVTQPGFVYAHGDRYLETVDLQDLPWLYRLRGWLDAGVPVSGGSDAPYGPLDPWASIRAAVTRETRTGNVLGANERLSPEAAVRLFMPYAGASFAPQVGDTADLCLLGVPWSQARSQLDASLVVATFVAGSVIWIKQ